MFDRLTDSSKYTGTQKTKHDEIKSPRGAKPEDAKSPRGENAKSPRPVEVDCCIIALWSNIDNSKRENQFSAALLIHPSTLKRESKILMRTSELVSHLINFFTM